jgi:hypothetical protein
MVETQLAGGRLTAVYTQGKLLLAAEGLKPGSSCRVRFEPMSPGAERLCYVLRQYGVDVGGAMPETPYQIASLFHVGSPPDEVTIRSQAGDERVPVLVASDPDALYRRESVPLVNMAVAREIGDLLPSPFLEMLEAAGERIQPPIVWPMRLGPLFEGRLEPASANLRRATGYSDDFDFREAFLDALRNLPQDGRPDADTLTIVHITASGALLSGSDGFRRLFVSILAY